MKDFKAANSNFPMLSKWVKPLRTTVFLLFILCACNQRSQHFNYTGWPAYGGGVDMIRYSSLNQIDTTNVGNLVPAWIYHSNDLDTSNKSQIQCNPIVVNGVLYGSNPAMKLFALDAETGKEKWVFDPIQVLRETFGPHVVAQVANTRGVAYWSDGKGEERLFFGAGSFTYAVDPKTGKSIPSFGKNGAIDLHEGLGRDVYDLYIVSSTPGIVYKDLLILGDRVDEALPSAPGHIRAFDVRTGEIKWIFHTIPQPGEFGFDSWDDSTKYKTTGAVNVWSGFALDKDKGILFAPTGSAAYDFYGADRKGANLYSDCLLALDANTGKRIWHYQFVHHDIWDRDLPTPPSLVTFVKEGKKVEAVAQPTKQGYLFVLDRTTGKPIFDIEEVPVDSLPRLPGEQIWPTQPRPIKPEPFSRQSITETDVNPYLPDSSKALMLQKMASYRIGKMFMPPNQQTQLIFPGYDGGAEWGGPSFDPETGMFYVNTNEMAWTMQLLEQKEEKKANENYLQAGQRLYRSNCLSCHGPNREGGGNIPAIVGVFKKLNDSGFHNLLQNGRRMMPAFKQLQEKERMALACFILNQKEKQKQPFNFVSPKPNPAFNMPYRLQGYVKFLSPEGLPGITPPWGTLTAIDLNKGEIAWKVPLGEYEELKKKGVSPTGTENYGGPISTAGGLVFIAATRDSKIRAFNKKTGRLLWEHDLPAAGFATPAMYEMGGRQFIVIACGGGKLGAKSGDAYVAFALPKN